MLSAAVLVMSILPSAQHQGSALHQHTLPRKPTVQAAMAAQAVPWDAAVQRYRSFVEADYLMSASVQTATLRASANVLAQTVMLQRGMIAFYDVRQTIAMGLLGLTVSGYVKAAWMRRLEHLLGAGRTDRRAVIAKTLASLLVWAPFAGVVYLLGLPLLRGQGWAVAALTLQTKFARVMLVEATVFTPYSAPHTPRVTPHVAPRVTASHHGGCLTQQS